MRAHQTRRSPARPPNPNLPWAATKKRKNESRGVKTNFVCGSSYAMPRKEKERVQAVRGQPFMTSVKFWRFLTPSAFVRILLLSRQKNAFGTTPFIPQCERHLWILPNRCGEEGGWRWVLGEQRAAEGREGEMGNLPACPVPASLLCLIPINEY